MDLNAYDAQVLVCKVAKISTNTCVNVSKKHPYVTSCFLFLYLIYICCPLLFWILVYSLPLVVSTWVVLSFRGSRRCVEESSQIEREQKERESSLKLRFTEKEVEDTKRIKKAYSRVHSVRRRRAKDLSFEDFCTDAGSRADNDRVDQEMEEDDSEDENTAAFPSIVPHTIDKKAMNEESLKEIRQVEVHFPLANAKPEEDVSIDHKLYQNSDVTRSLKLLKDEEDARDEASKAIDVNIAEAERNKRLECLIARRRSQKRMDLQAKRALASTEAMPPIAIPKINTRCSPNKAAGSPGPGSAPTVLIPMKNPFDLPYDPHEEKLDLTSDSFQQEFATGHGRDFMFCRHESFSLGPSLPMDFFDDCEDASSIDDFGFRRRRSSMGYYFPKPENEESDTEFDATTDAESGQEWDSKSNTDISPKSDHDQIKEVIQEHQNTTQNHNAQQNTRPNARDDSGMSSNSSSIGSSEEDERPPMCKINREAILKSLSIRRSSVSVPDIKSESSDQLKDNNLSYANSALENASRLKQQYFAANKPQKCHGMTFSIASDMQVEVSELSSPRENMSYQDDASAYDGEMERNAPWDGLDSWAGSSRVSETEDNETRLTQATEPGASRSQRLPEGSTDDENQCINSSSSDSEVSESQGTAPESSTSGEIEEQPAMATVDEAISSNANPSQERVQHATVSPKSVLQPALSVTSVEHDGDRAAEASQEMGIQESTHNEEGA